ncbi:MAG: shikimate dehydrogenase [Magnetococcales bacterium]|nr:shikimate dehydrogenase [Magnetococcales bacterium]
MSASSPDWLLDGQTRLLGVLGDPIAHSLSPAMHNFALARQGINARYLPFHVEPARLEQAVRGLVAVKAIGFNATVPHKEALFRLMDWCDPAARALGAVNTVKITPEGRLEGYNTDVYGFGQSLREHFGVLPADLPVIMLGAGGAARAVLEGLLTAGLHDITVANRTLPRAEEVVDACRRRHPRASVRACSLATVALDRCGLLVNTTTAGLHGDALEEVDCARLPVSARVMDIVYGQETPLLAQAGRLGLSTADGLGMLLHQGAAAYHLWTGREMPVDAVRDHLQRILRQRANHA